MIVTATEADGLQIQDITARAGVFSQEEVECVIALWEEYLTLGRSAAVITSSWTGKTIRFSALHAMARAI